MRKYEKYIPVNKRILYAENFAVNLDIQHHGMMWTWEETGSYQSTLNLQQK